MQTTAAGLPRSSAASRMRLSMVGTTMAWVMPSWSAICTHSLGSNCGRYMIRRPEYTLERMVAMPAMWYGGNADQRGLVLVGRPCNRWSRGRRRPGGGGAAGPPWARRWYRW